MEQLTAGKHYEKEFQEKENRREEPQEKTTTEEKNEKGFQEKTTEEKNPTEENRRIPRGEKRREKG